MNSNLLGMDIRWYRTQKGWSQAELAKKINHSRAFMLSIERGKRKLSPGIVMKLADALCIPDTELGLTDENRNLMNEVKQSLDQSYELVKKTNQLPIKAAEDYDKFFPKLTHESMLLKNRFIKQVIPRHRLSAYPKIHRRNEYLRLTIPIGQPLRGKRRGQVVARWDRSEGTLPEATPTRRSELARMKYILHQIGRTQ